MIPFTNAYMVIENSSENSSIISNELISSIHIQFITLVAIVLIFILIKKFKGLIGL